MEILKEICQQYSKWKPLENYILRIETYVDSDGVLVLENCKAMVESVCKEILNDLQEPYSPNETIHSLVSKTCNKMVCIPNTSDLARSFITVAQRLGEFRNAFTTIAHGQPMNLLDENRKRIVGASVTFMLTTVEQLVIFLITVYQEEYPINLQSQLRYEDDQEFNSLFDEQNDIIEIGQYGPYSPSEVLFYIDKNAYRTELVKSKEEL